MNTINSYIKKEVAVLGANTTFGKMTSFLLKQSPLLSSLALYDDKNINHLGDIKYVNTPCKVSFFNGKEQISEAIKTADIIIIGDDNIKGMGHEATFMTRAPSFSNYVRQIADVNSDAIIVVATNPVNMTVPLAAEVLRDLGKLDERKLLGMTNVDSVKARSILAHHLQVSPGMIDLPVVGGLTSETSVPLLSNMSPPIPLNKANLQKITCAVKTSETKLHNAEGSQESLNRAYSTAKLIKSIVAGLNGHPTVETVLSYQKIIGNTDFFSLPVLLGENGILSHMALPNISKREKYLLSHAITCMAADSKKAKICYDKLSNNFVKPISAPQNKLNKLKTADIQYKRPRSQYTSIPNGTETTFRLARSNETDAYDEKTKPNLDHIYASIYSCNEDIKKSIHENKNKTLNLKKSQTPYSTENRKENDTALYRKDNTSKILNKKGEQSEHIPGQIPKSRYISCSDASNTQSKQLKLYELLPHKINTGNSADHLSLALWCINNNEDRSLTLDNKKLVTESEKTTDNENSLLEFKTATKNLNAEKEIISTNPTINLINSKLSTKIMPSQVHNESKNCAVGENKACVRYNNTGEQTTTSETIPTDSQKKCFHSESLGKIFTSNIVRMVETQNRKRGIIATSSSMENQSEQNNTKAINVGLESNKNNHKHFDLCKINSTKTGDIKLIIDKSDMESMSNISFIGSIDAKISGEKYSLQTNQPHWILQSMLFKSHQSSKQPMLSRYASSESSESKVKKQITGVKSVKEIRQMTTLSKSQRNINKPQESFRSESEDKGIKNKEFMNPNSENIKKQTMTPHTAFQTNIKSPRDVFLSRCISLESGKKPLENESFNSENKTKQVSSLSNFQKNIDGPHVTSSTPDAAIEPHAEGMRNQKLNSEENVSQINSQPKTQQKVNKPNESTITFQVEKFRSKHYDVQQNIYINSKKSSDNCVFGNLLQRQMNTISSGHKIASFRAESPEDSFYMLQRKSENIEMLDKKAQQRNNRNDFQKLHLLSKKSNEYLMKDKVLENELKSSEVNKKYWQNKYLKRNKENSMTEISKGARSKTTGQNIDDHHQCNKTDKTFYSDQPPEKDECKPIIGNKSFETCNNQVEGTAFKYEQKETIMSEDESVTEVIQSNINDIHLSKLQENVSGENSTDPNSKSKYIQQRPTLPSEASSIYTEEIKCEENSLKHIPSKESKSDTV